MYSDTNIDWKDLTLSLTSALPQGFPIQYTFSPHLTNRVEIIGTIFMRYEFVMVLRTISVTCCVLMNTTDRRNTDFHDDIDHKTVYCGLATSQKGWDPLLCATHVPPHALGFVVVFFVRQQMAANSHGTIQIREAVNKYVCAHVCMSMCVSVRVFALHLVCQSDEGKRPCQSEEGCLLAQMKQQQQQRKRLAMGGIWGRGGRNGGEADRSSRVEERDWWGRCRESSGRWQHLLVSLR